LVTGVILIAREAEQKAKALAEEEAALKRMAQ
jgi:hypothetical protein